MADSADSPELGPPPMSQFIDEDPVKIDSPSRQQAEIIPESPKLSIEAPPALSSPQRDDFVQRSPSPEKKKQASTPQLNDMRPPKLVLTDKPVSQPVKAGSKRKLSVRDDIENVRPQKISNENQILPPLSDKQSIRDKTGGRTLKELTSMRKEARVKTTAGSGTRKPLAAKSTNDDITSPKKASQIAVTDEVAVAKADLIKSKASQDRTKARMKNPPVIKAEVIPLAEPVAPVTTSLSCELGKPLTEPALLAPSSPETAPAKDGTRGGTPPPTDINSQAATMRPSRRNRTAVSYAEPNLRDKMRRPTKELFDAVAGEGKYARRSSSVEQLPPESARVKRESGAEELWKQLPQPDVASKEQALDNIPGSPCAGKGLLEDLPSSVTTNRRKRMSAMVREAEEAEEDDTEDKASEANTSAATEVDVYEFEPSSPQSERPLGDTRTKATSRKTSRRFSTNHHTEDTVAPKERASRRKSMMV